MADTSGNDMTQSQKMELILSQLVEYESNLRKNEHSLRAKIHAEQSAMGKIVMRRDFYNKLRTNMESKHKEALSQKETAEKAMRALQDEYSNLESQTIELKAELDDVTSQNEQNVLPEMERLATLLKTCQGEVIAGRKLCDEDEQRCIELSKMNYTIRADSDEIMTSIEERKATLASLPDPKTEEEEICKIEKDMLALKNKINEDEDKKKRIISEIDLQKDRNVELEKQNAWEQKMLKAEEAKTDELRREVDESEKALGEERVRQHSLASRRLEIEMNLSAEEVGINHDLKFLSIDKRQLNIAKSSLEKRRQTLIRSEDLLSQLKSKLSDLQITLSNVQSEKSSIEQTQFDLRSKLDSSLQKLLEQENIDNELQRRLHNVTKLVSDRECEVEKLRVEDKKTKTISIVTREKRTDTRRRLEQAEQMKSDIQDALRLRKLIQIDMTKKNHDTAAKIKDISCLLEMIENEKMETTRLIDSTHEALETMKGKSDKLQDELRALTLERNEKMGILHKIRKDVETSSKARASNRSEKSLSWSSYRVQLSDVLEDEARAENLKSTLSLLKKDVDRMEIQYKHMLDAKDLMAEQLVAKKSQLDTLLNNINIYTETLKKGEIVCKQIEDDINANALKNELMQVSIDKMASELEDPTAMENKIHKAKEKLDLLIRESVCISNDLESPNQERIRWLEGRDPNVDDLKQSLETLQSLERKNQEVLRSRAIAIKELTNRCEKFKEECNDWKSSTQSYFKDINEYEGRIRDLRRAQIAQMSELQMYDALIHDLKTTQVNLEMDIALHGQRNSEPERGRHFSRTGFLVETTQLKQPRPTAYIPTGDDDEIIKVPKPYGSMAPFQPTEPGKSMRHIRQPQPISLLPHSNGNESG